MNLSVNRITLKLFLTEHKLFISSRNLCNSFLSNKSHMIISNSSFIKANQTSRKYVSTSTPKQDSDNTQKSQPPPLILMDFPRTVFPNIFKVMALRFRIAFHMFQLDNTFHFGQFLMGTEQVCFGFICISYTYITISI